MTEDNNQKPENKPAKTQKEKPSSFEARLKEEKWQHSFEGRHFKDTPGTKGRIPS
jgi:hypothetical protein